MAQNVLLPELRKNAIQFDIRKLQVGDFLWVAKPRGSGNYWLQSSVSWEVIDSAVLVYSSDQSNVLICVFVIRALLKLNYYFFLFSCFKAVFEKSEDKEVVLDFIIERKRLDDLAGSIIDGRFREQKVILNSIKEHLFQYSLQLLPLK